jgi:hypothetical protein
MSRSIQVVVAPGLHAARVLVTEGPMRTLLRAHLSPATAHPRALAWFRESLALWEGATVHAVLAVDERRAGCASTLCRDAFTDGGTPPLYTLEWVPVARARRGTSSGLRSPRTADFRDLHDLARAAETP